MRIYLLTALLMVGLTGCELNVTERVKTFDCPSASRCTGFVACEKGETLTGGGFTLGDLKSGVLEIWGSHPDIGKNRWRVTAKNKQRNNIKFSIYAMCGRVAQ